MARTLRFAMALVVGLALVTCVAVYIVLHVTNDWFESDIRLRSQLAINAARQGLLNHWTRPRPTELQEALVGITRDQRIMAAASCSPEAG